MRYVVIDTASHEDLRFLTWASIHIVLLSRLIVVSIINATIAFSGVRLSRFVSEDTVGGTRKRGERVCTT